MKPVVVLHSCKPVRRGSDSHRTPLARQATSRTANPTLQQQRGAEDLPVVGFVCVCARLPACPVFSVALYTAGTVVSTGSIVKLPNGFNLSLYAGVLLVRCWKHNWLL